MNDVHFSSDCRAEVEDGGIIQGSIREYISSDDWGRFVDVWSGSEVA